MNSLVANYLVRLRVTTHVTTALVARLPMPRPRRESEAFARLAAGARVLEREARAMGADTRDLSAFEQLPVWADVQACAAREYGLSRDALEHVLGTFPLVDLSAKRGILERYK
jgi:hypothetical protein